MAPGPMLALVIGQVLAQGFAAVIWIVLGHALLELVFVVGMARGLTGVLCRPRVRGTFSLIGGGVLLWMGLGLALNAATASLQGSAATAIPGLRLVVAGAGLSLANPYFVGWWVTVGTGQVAALKLDTRAHYAAFFIGHELGDLAWYGLVALVLTFGRAWLSDGLYQALLLACGLVVAGLGALFCLLAARCLAGRTPTVGVSTTDPQAADARL